MTFTQTDLLGVYVATAIRPASDGAIRESSADAVADTAAVGDAAGIGCRRRGGTSSTRTRPIRFAVDLFDVAESTITPGSAAVLEKLGRAAAVPVRPPRPVPQLRRMPAAASRPPARDELWFPIVLIVLDRPVRRVGALSPRRRDPGMARPVEPGPAARTRECLTWASPSTRRSRCSCSFPLSA